MSVDDSISLPNLWMLNGFMIKKGMRTEARQLMLDAIDVLNIAWPKHLPDAWWAQAHNRKHQHPQLWKYYLEVGFTLAQDRELEQALKFFEKAHKQVEYEPEPMKNMGRALKELGRREPARAILQRCVR